VPRCWPSSRDTPSPWRAPWNRLSPRWGWRAPPGRSAGVSPGPRGAQPTASEIAVRRPASPEDPPRVLSGRELKVAPQAGWITASRPIDDAQIQPASLDLRLGATAYQLRASFLPCGKAVLTRLHQPDYLVGELVIDELSLEGGATLQPRSVYLVPL